MVLLTMLPGEMEHTRELAYSGDITWPPVFHLQPRTDFLPRPESSLTGEASDSLEGSILASNDTTPPPEDEMSSEHSMDKDGTTVTAVETHASLEERPLSAQKSSDGVPILPIKSCETVINTQDSGFIGNNEAFEPAAKEESLTQIEPESMARSDSYGRESNPTTNAEDAHERFDVENRMDTPSTAISCTSTFPTIDSPSTRLRHMIANSPSIITCPGVYDGLSARIALHVGFKAMYMTGAGTTASCLGASDLGIAHLHDMRTNAEMIANLQPDGPPLIADMDTGYGGPLIISRAVKQYARAGVAAFHIEDQVPEKRCGHLAGKEVVDIDTYLRRIKACLDARDQIRSDIIIIARTDALQSRGYDDCIERLRRARDLGADMGILEGVSSKEMAAQAVKDLAPWPLCYNSVENGHSPLITADEAQAMGYRLMIFSFAGIAPAYMAIMDTFTKLKEHGVTGSMVGPKKIFEVCGLEEEIRIDGAAGSSMLAKGV